MIQVFQYQNSPIQFEVIDGQVMANATVMFKSNNARLDNWKLSDTTKRYIEAITRNLGISENQVVTSRRGSSENGGGTWIHEKLILNAARYISIDFELWCDEKIAELLRTGTVSIGNPNIEKIAKHIERPVQIQNSKDINAFNFERGGVERVKEYNQKNCYEHTKKLPSELIRIAKENGVPSKHRTSGKEVVRYYKPEWAASMSMTDELCKTGAIGVERAAELAIPAIPLFKEMIRQGLLNAATV